MNYTRKRREDRLTVTAAVLALLGVATLVAFGTTQPVLTIGLGVAAAVFCLMAYLVESKRQAI